MKPKRCVVQQCNAPATIPSLVEKEPFTWLCKEHAKHTRIKLEMSP